MTENLPEPANSMCIKCLFSPLLKYTPPKVSKNLINQGLCGHAEHGNSDGESSHHVVIASMLGRLL